MLPILVQPGVIEGVGFWRRAILKPSDGDGDLLRVLALSMLAPDALPELGSDGTTADQLAELLRQGPATAFPLIKGGLSQAAAAMARERDLPHQPEARLVIVADQLEELFTLPSVTHADRQEFLAALAALARSGRVWVIGTLRGDYYHRAFEYPELIALLEGSGLYALPLPTAAEIGQMIRHPARAAGLSFEEDPQTGIPLHELLREAAGASPESLPLLEFTLEELYHRRTGDSALTFAAYNDLGGVEGALTRRAEATFADLPPDVQATLPRIMRALVGAGDGEGATRQQANWNDVASTEQTRAFLDAFIRARLFTTDRKENGQAVVGVTHEALIRTWPRMQRWLEQDRELLIVRARVGATAARWRAEGRRHDLLLGEGKPITEAEGLAAALGSELPPPVLELIEASRRRRRGRTLLKRAAIAALVMLSVAASLAAGYARWQHYQAEKNAQAAVANERRAIAGENEAKQNASSAELRLAEGLVSQGDALGMAGRGDEARETYRQAHALFLKHGASPFPAESGLGTLHAAIPTVLRTYTPFVRTKEMEPPFLLMAMDLGAMGTISVNSLAFSVDGRRPLLGTASGLRIWEPTAGGRIRDFGKESIESVHFVISPDGRLGLAVNMEGSFVLLDLEKGQIGRTFRIGDGERMMMCFAFTPDNNFLVFLRDGTLKLWDVETGRASEIRSEKGDAGGGVSSCAISLDGRRAVCVGTDLALWDLNARKLVRRMGAYPSQSLLAAYQNQSLVAISPDGSQALSAEADSSLKLWDLETGREVRTIAGHSEPIWTVAFTRDGKRAVSASCGKEYSFKIWDLTTGRAVRTIGGDDVRVFSDYGLKIMVEQAPDKAFNVAVSLDGNWALAINPEFEIKLWTLNRSPEYRTLTAHGRGVTRVEFSPGGLWARSASGDGSIDLWDLKSGKNLQTLTGKFEWNWRLATSPEGNRAIREGDYAALERWPPEFERKRGFLPSDQTLAAISVDGHRGLTQKGTTYTLWDLETGKERRTFICDSGLTMSPDGRRALSIDYWKLGLWDLGTGEVVRSFTVNTRGIECVAFSPDGHWAASGGKDGVLRLWYLEKGKELRSLTAQDDSISAVAFSPDGRRILVVSGDQTVVLWDFSREERCQALEARMAKAQLMLAEKPDDPDSLAVLGEWYAFQGVPDRAMDAFSKALAGGARVDPLTVAACFWELSDGSPSYSSLTRDSCLESAGREYTRAWETATEEGQRSYLRLCQSAVERARRKPTAGDEKAKPK